jgi:excisionase family DNA binding protein
MSSKTVTDDLNNVAVPVVTRLLPLQTVAQTLSVSPHTVRAWVRKGQLRPVSICRRLLFSPDEIARFVKQGSK